MEIGDWAKILTLASSLVIYAVTIRKDVDAQASMISRIETKVDGLLVANAQLAVLAARVDAIERRVENAESKR